MIREEIIKNVKSFGAEEAQIVKLTENDISKFAQIVESYPDTMLYLKNRALERANPKIWFNQAKSILLAIFPYWDNSKDHKKINDSINDPYSYLVEKGRKPPDFLKNKKFQIARFALCGDYHISIKEALKKALEESAKIMPELKWKIFVDSSPVFEKDLVQKAGLAFQGKNTLAINKNLGSYFFIGGAMLNIDEGIEPLKTESLCKDCTLCIRACPTSALSEYRMNPVRCISYWTTHKTKTPPPYEIMTLCEKRYGCDICQEVCPYNKNRRAKS